MQLHEEKIAAIQEKLELSDQKLAQFSKLPEMEEELKARMEALTQVGSQVGRQGLSDVDQQRKKHRFTINVENLLLNFIYSRFFYKLINGLYYIVTKRFTFKKTNYLITTRALNVFFLSTY